MTGPPRPLLALALGAACVLMLLIAWRFRKEAKRIALAPFAAWRDLAGDRAMNAALGSAAGLFGVLACMVLVRLDVPGALWLVFGWALLLDVSLWGMYEGTAAFASAIHKARRYTSIDSERARAVKKASAAKALNDGLEDHLFEVRLPVVGLASLEGQRVVRVTPEFREIVGAEPGEIEGHLYTEFIYAPDAEATARTVAGTLETPDALVADFRNRWRHFRTGAVVWIEWHQLTRDGRIWKARDVTAEVERERRLAEAETGLAEAEADLAAIRPVVQQIVRTASADVAPGEALPVSDPIPTTQPHVG